jgi:cysteine desulfurase
MSADESKKKIYLDFNASTPVDPAVAGVMRCYLEDAFGNPSSGHWAAEPARAAVEVARRQVAALLGCAPAEVVFTSGGSESDNLAIKGVLAGSRDAHIITSAVEHPAVVEPCRYLERQGVHVTWLDVDARGRVDPGELRKAIRPGTALVTIAHAVGETGTVQPIAECARIAREHGVPFHTDAAQSVGKVNTAVDDLGVDLLTVAGHKLYAPKGIGALYVRGGVELEPLVHGADHEGGRRAGTESAMLAAALGKACELAGDLAPMERVRALRDRLWSLLHEALGERIVRNGHPHACLPNTLHASFIGRIGAGVLASVPEIAASTGSACHTGRVELSAVLKAMGMSRERGNGAVRFSLGRTTTEAEVERAASLIIHRLT